jgi:GAF domain-containing protein
MSMAFERMQALFYMTERQHALTYTLDMALALIPSAAGALLLYDFEARDLFLAVSRGPGGAAAPGYRVPVGQGLAGFCALEGLPLALTDVDQDQRFHSLLSQHFGLAVRSIAGAPLQYEGRFYGVLEVVNRQPDGVYTTEELNTLAYLGRQIAERLATTLGS